MRSIAIRRLRKIPVPKYNQAAALNREEIISEKHKLTILAEIAQMGYNVKNPDMLDAVSESFLLDYKNSMVVLKQMRGGDVDYFPLFVNFPDDVPNDDEYFAKRVMGYVGNFLHLFDAGTELENGMFIPDWLFDLRDFGADPITQFQTESQFKNAKDKMNKRKSDDHIEWIDIEFVYDSDVVRDLGSWVKSNVYAKSSIKQEYHEDIENILRVHCKGLEIDLNEVTIKENRALVSKVLWDVDPNLACNGISVATDVLRLFAAITGSDVSLADPIKFPKLSRKNRRMILGVLDNCSDLEDSMHKYRGLWLQIGRYLHPGEYANRFRKVSAAFDKLRNGKIRTVNSKIERAINDGDIVAALNHLWVRPGVFAKKLHELLRKFPNKTNTIIAHFQSVSHKIPVKNLMVMRDYFHTINSMENRTVINKKGKIKIIDNNSYLTLNSVTQEDVIGAINEAILKQLAEKDSWKGKKVWLDPNLDLYTVPLQQRAASDGLLNVGRGSRIKIDMDKVVRLFVYWKESGVRTDLDLSAISFDDDFNYVGHVSWTRLSGKGIVHSGDIQSAPRGAAEFIDIPLSALDKNVRYISGQIYVYCGDTFTDLTCHSGWMIRNKTDKRYKSFDIKTVANKFDLNGKGRYCVPMLIDIKSGEVIITDLYMNGMNTVEGSKESISEVVRAIAAFKETRPTMNDLADFHVKARNAELVENKDDADITFGLSDCVYNVTDVETVLSELL